MIKIHHHASDPIDLIDAVNEALRRDWPSLAVQFRDDGPMACWRVDVPDHHGVEDAEGDEYTPHALWASICGSIEEAAYDAGFPNPL